MRAHTRACRPHERASACIAGALEPKLESLLRNSTLHLGLPVHLYGWAINQQALVRIPVLSKMSYLDDEDEGDVPPLMDLGSMSLLAAPKTAKSTTDARPPTTVQSPVQQPKAPASRKSKPPEDIMTAW